MAWIRYIGQLPLTKRASVGKCIYENPYIFLYPYENPSSIRWQSFDNAADKKTIRRKMPLGYMQIGTWSSMLYADRHAMHYASTMPLTKRTSVGKCWVHWTKTSFDIRKKNIRWESGNPSTMPRQCRWQKEHPSENATRLYADRHVI